MRYSIAASMDLPRTTTSASLACGSVNPISTMAWIAVALGSYGGGGGGGGGLGGRSPAGAVAAGPARVTLHRDPSSRAPPPALAATRSGTAGPFPRCTSADMSVTTASPGHAGRSEVFHARSTAGAKSSCILSANAFAVAGMRATSFSPALFSGMPLSSGRRVFSRSSRAPTSQSAAGHESSSKSAALCGGAVS